MSHRARKPPKRYGWEIVAVSSPIWLLLLCGVLSGLWQFIATVAALVVICVSTFGTLTLLERARRERVEQAPPVIPFGFTNGVGPYEQG